MSAKTEFGCLCLKAVVAPGVSELREDLVGEFQIGAPSEPFDVEVWIPAFGEHALEALRKPDICIWIRGSQGARDDLIARLELFWKAMMLCRAPRTFSGWLVSGTTRSTGSCIGNVASLMPLWTKEPPYPIGLPTLRDASETAQILGHAFAAHSIVGRLERGLAAFFSGMHDQHVDESVLSLERALEGVFHPRNGKQFAERVSSVVSLAGRSREQTAELLRETYNIRNKFTHAVPVGEALPSLTREQSLLRCRQHQALLYAMASAIYHTILRDEPLMRRLGDGDASGYWEDVVHANISPPFSIAITDERWLHSHEPAHYFNV